jgi:hypothetical protein
MMSPLITSVVSYLFIDVFCTRIVVTIVHEQKKSTVSHHFSGDDASQAYISFHSSSGLTEYFMNPRDTSVSLCVTAKDMH